MNELLDGGSVMFNAVQRLNGTSQARLSGRKAAFDVSSNAVGQQSI
jgi:hypothetical protein